MICFHKVFNNTFKNGERTIQRNGHCPSDQSCLFWHAKCSRNGAMCKYARGGHESLQSGATKWPIKKNLLSNKIHQMTTVAVKFPVCHLTN